MKSEHETWIEQLSEYVDGHLQDARLRGVEDHLLGCGQCREIVADLRDLKDAARQLGPVQPSRDLWPAIASGMAATPHDADVIALPVDRQEAPRLRRPSGVYMTMRQLAAASVVLATLSAAATWWAGVGVATRPVTDSSQVATSPVSAIAPVADAPGPPAALAEELETLEEAVAQARGRLDPNTVRILEKNLGVIQRAIDESVQALAVDPGNAFLLEHLQGAYQEKAAFLREAVGLVDWEG